MKESAARSRPIAAVGSLLAIAIIGAGLWLTVRQLWVPYSFWLDELLSVNASSSSLSRLHEFLLADVHPPLYQLVLMAWMALFGSNEPVTRTLSWVFAIAAVAVLVRFGRRFGKLFVLVSVGFVCSNRLFLYYSNETRSYALALFLSALVLATFPFGRAETPSIRFLVACLLLALTHYFGVLLAIVALAFAYAGRRADVSSRKRVVAAALLCLAWPVYHAFNGSVLGWTGGNHWIRVDGIGESLALAAFGYVPGLPRLVAAALLVSGLGAACGVAALVRANPRGADIRIADVSLGASVMALLFLAIVALLDRFTAVSTTRNYIVLLPFIAVSLAATVVMAVERFPRSRPWLLTLAVAYGMLSLSWSSREIDEKRQSGQDWDTAFRVAVAGSADRQILVHSYSIAGVGVGDHYLRKYGVDPSRAEPYEFRDTSGGEPAVLVYGGLLPDDYEALLRNMQAIGARRVYPETEADDVSSTGVYLIE